MSGKRCLTEGKTRSSKTVIVVTDGDKKAERAIRIAASRLGMYVVSCSAGAPTHAMVDEVEQEINRAESDVVVVMADDGGKVGEGAGETLVRMLNEHGLVSAAVAAASNTPGVKKVIVLESITDKGRRTKQAVNKLGRRQKGKALAGDTAEGLADLQLPVIGIGDPGKLESDRKGALVMEKALREALEAVRRKREG
jgi:hypothetical protein